LKGKKKILIGQINGEEKIRESIHTEKNMPFAPQLNNQVKRFYNADC